MLWEWCAVFNSLFVHHVIDFFKFFIFIFFSSFQLLLYFVYDSIINKKKMNASIICMTANCTLYRIHINVNKCYWNTRKLVFTLTRTVSTRVLILVLEWSVIFVTVGTVWIHDCTYLAEDKELFHPQISNFLYKKLYFFWYNSRLAKTLKCLIVIDEDWRTF